MTWASGAIAAAFPHVKCSVLDLPHVVSEARADGAAVEFVAGDMFDFIPKADAVLLKVLFIYFLYDGTSSRC